MIRSSIVQSNLQAETVKTKVCYRFAYTQKKNTINNNTAQHNIQQQCSSNNNNKTNNPAVHFTAASPKSTTAPTTVANLRPTTQQPPVGYILHNHGYYEK